MLLSTEHINELFHIVVDDLNYKDGDSLNINQIIKISDLEGLNQYEGVLYIEGEHFCDYEYVDYYIELLNKNNNLKTTLWCKKCNMEGWNCKLEYKLN